MVAVRSILIRLRKRSGLSANRLNSTEIDTTALLQLTVVRRYSHQIRATPNQVLPSVIAQLARQLPPAHRLIVDAELCLGHFRADPPPGIDLERLYAADLGERRHYVTEQWAPLHRALGVTDIPAAPTVRTLRDVPEAQAFTALAVLLTNASDLDIASPSSQPTVTVLGDAVIDQINVVEKFPEPGESIWGDFLRYPGGKGLNRAVALARLGLDTRLIATIGADLDGDEIQKYLEEQRVDASLLKVDSDARTPVATAIMPLRGESVTIAFQKDRFKLTERDLTSHAVRGAIEGSDAVLLTFEQPIDIVARAVAMIAALRIRPRLILSASPPRLLPKHLHEHLCAVDYLIGTPKEVAAMWPDSSVQESTQELLQLGVGAVCTVDSAGCTVRSARGESVLPHVNRSMAGSAGASAAFSAALVYRLLLTGRLLDEVDLGWAVAAMSARRPVAGIPASMPSVTAVDEVVANGNLNGDIVIRRG